MQCGCCVCPNKIKSKVVVRNRKYCWLYPYYERAELKQTHFDEHKTFYTKCDFVLEQCAHKKILGIEALLKEYAQLFEVEIKLQKPLLSAMWKHATRWTVLTRGGVCGKLYPEVVSLPMEKIAECNYKENYQELRASLARLALKLEAIRETIDALNEACAQLDMTVESTFIVGNLTTKPLAHIRSSIFHLFNYHYHVFCKLIKWAQLLHIDDPAAIEDYTALVNASKNFKKFLMKCNKNCSCMRTTNPECLIQHMLPNDLETCMQHNAKKKSKEQKECALDCVKSIISDLL